MAAFTIRPAGLADAEALCALHKASVRALCVGAYTMQEIEAWLSEREPAGVSPCHDRRRRDHAGGRA